MEPSPRCVCIKAPRCPAGSKTVEKGPLGAWLLGPASDPGQAHAAGQQPWLQEADRVEILAPPRIGQEKGRKPSCLLQRQEQRQPPGALHAHSHLPKPSKELRPTRTQRGLPHRTGGTTFGERSGSEACPGVGVGSPRLVVQARRDRFGLHGGALGVQTEQSMLYEPRYSPL